jgi:hypothetical protein
MIVHPKTAKIRVTKPFYIAGVLKPTGEVLDLPYAEAREFVAMNKAEMYVEPEKQAEPVETALPAAEGKKKKGAD